MPVALAASNNDVRVFLCSHRKLPPSITRTADVDWIGLDVRTLGLQSFINTLVQQAEEFRPDWVIGVSDAHYGAIAQFLARKTGAQLAVDAYDNYEAYMPWNFPLHWLWRRAIRAADLVTAAGPQLAQRLQSHRRGGHEVEILPMAADPEFKPMDKFFCRRQLGLPEGVPLLGYVGSWAKNRGTHLLIDAFRIVRKVHPDARLILSGRPPAYALSEPGVVSLGYIADEQLSVLINAVDVACVITANTGFGRYSYPAKLCEAMACNVAVAATATEPVQWMLNGKSRHLVPPGDADAFAERVIDLLASPGPEYGHPPTWASQGLRLDYLLTSLTRQNR